MKLKMWVGNLDGRREGLVIAATKVRAREIIGHTSRATFESYWHERPVDPQLEPEVLYTRPFGTFNAPWCRGKCPLKTDQ